MIMKTVNYWFTYKYAIYFSVDILHVFALN